ncbi:MAG: hypothetical protein J6K23_00620 [Bacilli bacterium]|nr:hypothetical protein [Bacilli bacterium]
MKDYNVTAYVLLKVKFKQPTNDIYKLAKITEDFCRRTIKDARKKVKILEVGMKKKLKLLLRL